MWQNQKKKRSCPSVSTDGRMDSCTSVVHHGQRKGFDTPLRLKRISESAIVRVQTLHTDAKNLTLWNSSKAKILGRVSIWLFGKKPTSNCFAVNGGSK